MTRSSLHVLQRVLGLATVVWGVVGGVLSCGPSEEVVNLCEDICQCEGCSDQQRSGCEAFFRGERKAAAAYGCDEEQREHYACLNEKARCVDGSYGDPDQRCTLTARRVAKCIDRESDIDQPGAGGGSP